MSMTRRRLLDNTFKKSVVGNPAIATDSLARMYPGIEMQGWTEQDSTTGAQLLNLTENTVTDSGITCVSEGSTITISGERVTGDGGRLTYVTSTFTLQPGTYRFSYEKFNDVNSSILVAILMKQADNKILGNAFTLAEETNLYIGVNIRQGKTADNAVIRCMLNSGSEALPYEPYTGGKPSPSPEYPQKIVSAGTQNQDTGKWEYEVEVGCGQLAEDSVVSHPEGEYVPDKIIFSGNITGEYTISLEEVGEVSYAQPGAGIINITINGKGEIIGKFQFPYTFSGNITEITVFSSKSYIMFTGTIKFMLNPGSTPLPYTPYRPPQTVTLTADRPLTKWDKLEKRNGQWGWVYKSEEIESYTDGGVPGEYFSTTGQLSVGAQVWYETTTETFVPLSSSEQEQMNNLYTYRPTTVLSNQQDCDMTLTYKSRKGMS